MIVKTLCGIVVFALWTIVLERARRVEVDKQYLTQKTNSRSAGCNFGGCAWSNMSTEARRQNLL